LEIERVVEEAAFNILKQAVIYLPSDVKQALKRAYSEETSETGKTQLETILKNIELAEKLEVPMCQDTGTIIFYVKAGSRVTDLDKVEGALIRSTRRATKEIPLRPNAVSPFAGKNSGDNTGRNIPAFNWDIVPGDSLEIIVMTKGGGSENVSMGAMLVPGEGIKGLKKFVVDTVIKSGAKPCPPNVLGVGIGGGADISMKLAKRALLRSLTEHNADPEIAKLEKEILEAVNMTGIGPMGLGGRTTALGVHIDYAFRHPASFPAAVAFSCWAARRAAVRIDAEGTAHYLTPKLKL